MMTTAEQLVARASVELKGSREKEFQDKAKAKLKAIESSRTITANIERELQDMMREFNNGL